MSVEVKRKFVFLGLKFTTHLAPRDGFEPSTQRLTAACSATELPRNSD